MWFQNLFSNFKSFSDNGSRRDLLRSSHFDLSLEFKIRNCTKIKFNRLNGKFGYEQQHAKFKGLQVNIHCLPCKIRTIFHLVKTRLIQGTRKYINHVTILGSSIRQRFKVLHWRVKSLGYVIQKTSVRLQEIPESAWLIDFMHGNEEQNLGEIWKQRYDMPEVHAAKETKIFYWDLFIWIEAVNSEQSQKLRESYNSIKCKLFVRRESELLRYFDDHRIIYLACLSHIWCIVFLQIMMGSDWILQFVINHHTWTLNKNKQVDNLLYSWYLPAWIEQ